MFTNFTEVNYKKITYLYGQYIKDSNKKLTTYYWHDFNYKCQKCLQLSQFSLSGNDEDEYSSPALDLQWLQLYKNVKSYTHYPNSQLLLYDRNQNHYLYCIFNCKMENHGTSFFLIDDCSQKASLRLWKNCSAQGMFHRLGDMWGLGSEHDVVTFHFKPRHSSDFPLTPCWRSKPVRLWNDRTLAPNQRYGLKFQSSAIWHRVNILDHHKNGDSKFIKKEPFPIQRSTWHHTSQLWDLQEHRFEKLIYQRTFNKNAPPFLPNGVYCRILTPNSDKATG